MAASKRVKKKTSKRKTARKKTAKKSTGRKSPSKKAAKKSGKPKKKVTKKKVTRKKATKKGSAKKPARARARAKTAKTGKKPKKKVTKKKKAAGKTIVKKKTVKKKPVRKRRLSAREMAKRYEPFRKLLLEKQAELTQAYKASSGDSRARQDDGTEDYIDYAVSSYAREFLLSLSEMDRERLEQVEAALARLTRGEYGLCRNCGEEIPSKRLEVAPWAEYCIRCQELADRGMLPDELAFDTEGDEDDEEAENLADDEEEEEEEEEEDDELDPDESEDD